MLLLCRHCLRLGVAIGPRVRCSKIRAACGIVKHRLSSSHQCGIILSQNQVVALLAQLTLHFRRDSRLQKNGALDWLSCVADGEAWSGESCLDVPAIVHYVGHKLRMRKRLIGTAHNPKSYVLVPPLHKCRNDGVEGTLVRAERIRMFGIEHKESSPILK